MKDWSEWLEMMSPVCPGMDHYASQESFDDLYIYLLCFVGRLFKEGHSSIIGTQPLSEQQWTDLISFVHRVRIDAIYQHVVGAYLNRHIIRKKTLLLIGDELRFKNLLNNAEIKHVNRLPRSSNAMTISEMKLEGDFFNTLLIGKRILSLELIEALASQLEPFAILYDGTQNGFRREFEEYWELITSYFPGTAKFALTTTGDQLIEKYRHKPLTHNITFRLGDWQDLQRPPEKTELSINCQFSDDKVFINTCNKILKILYDLKSNNEDESSELRKSFYRIFNLLENTVVPFDLLEHQLQKNARQGVFTVASIGKQLKDLKNKTFRYGTVQRQCDELISLVEEYLDCVEINGKTSLLLNQVQERISFGKTIIVLVDNKFQAQALFEYFSMQKIEFIEQVKILHKSAKPFKVLQDTVYDDLLITCKLWDSDYIWLTLPFMNIIFIGYSNNEKWLDYGFNKFDQLIAGRSKPNGDKLKLLTYQFKPDTVFLDSEVEEGDHIAVTKEVDLKSCGKYKNITHESIDITFDQSYLFEDIGESIEKEEEEVKHNLQYDRALCQIKVVLMDHPLCYPHEHVVQVLDEENNEPIQSIKVEDLKKGDMLITIKDSNTNRGNLLDEIFQEFIASSDFFMSYQLAQLWDDLVNVVSHHFEGKVKEIKLALEKQKVKRTPQTILSWLSHKRIGPKDEKDLMALATIVDYHSVINSCHKVYLAISSIRTVRRQIGKAINKSLRSNLDDDSTHTIAGHLISNDELRSLISVNEVIEVVIPTKPVEKKHKQLKELIPLVQKRFQNADSTLKCNT